MKQKKQQADTEGGASGNGKASPKVTQTTRDNVVLLMFFALLWGACIASVLLTRGPRSSVPKWASNIQTRCLDVKQSEWRAESDVFAEQDFAYLLFDPSTKLPVLPEKSKSVSHDDGIAVPEVQPSPVSNGQEPAVLPPNEGIESTNPEAVEKAFSGKLYSVEAIGNTSHDRLNLLEHFWGKEHAAPGTPGESGGMTSRYKEGKYIVFIKADECIVRKNEVLYATENDDKDGGQVRKFKPGMYDLLAYVTYHSVLGKRECDMRWAFQAAILSALVLLGFGYSLFYLRKELFNSTKKVALCSVCIIIHIVLLTVCQMVFQMFGGGPSFYLFALMPICLGSALASNLLGRRVGVCAAFLISALTPILVGGTFQFPLFLHSLTYSVAGIIAFQNVQKRKQFLWGGLGIGLVIFAIILFFAWQRELGWIWHSWEPFWIKVPLLVTINVMFVILSMLILPLLLEMIFGVTTVFTLNELNNMDHVLLERLRNEAPGTYEHSLAVARLASDAARAIGANAKLAETCAHFHDIGKLFNPKMFAENLVDGDVNQHDSLTPLESCSVLREHVKFGIELARKAHLPPPLVEAVAQHHGNGLMFGFYDKACRIAEAAGEPKPEPDDFLYYGQKPIRTEVVLVAMSDICEAAIRACTRHWDKISFKLIHEKVRELVQSKIDSGQFDEAELSMADLHDAMERIVESLCVMHHVRPDYPSSAEPKNNPSAPSEEEKADLTSSNNDNDTLTKVFKKDSDSGTSIL